MVVRRAEKKDIGRIIELLSQVLEVHAALRPDIFVTGKTKYTAEELAEKVDREPIYVAENDAGVVAGYVFCQLKEPGRAEYMVPFKTLFIDDLCVDESERGRGFAQALFEHARKEALRMGCYEITLNVWTGNSRAERFYEKMGMTTKERQLELIL